jgi:S1-C subfamily serine protease
MSSKKLAVWRAIGHNSRMRLPVLYAGHSWLRALFALLALVLASSQLALADDPKAATPAADSGMPVPKLKIRRRTLELLGNAPPLALEVNAGVIPRLALQAELARGIGRFLRQVRTEPALSRGRFVGWRLIGIFAGRSDVNVLVLKPGDTVLRVNGQSLERPEEFKVIWDSLPNASELVLDIQRDGRPSKLRYSIAG